MSSKSRDRTKKWRSKAGWKNIGVLLDPETANQFDWLLMTYRETNCKLVTRAVGNLYQATSGGAGLSTQEATSGELSVTSDQAIEVPNLPDRTGKMPNIHPKLEAIAQGISQGLTSVILRDDLKRAIRKLKEAGHTSPQIGELLFQARIPSPSGQTKWQERTIRKWWV